MEKCEEIGNSDTVSRQIDKPNMYRHFEGLIWDQVFMFPGGNPTSVTWRKYASNDSDVHELGRSRVLEKNARLGVDTHSYFGFISSVVKSVRQIDCEGFGFSVYHAPENEIHSHAEIAYRLPPGDKNKLTKSRKLELKQRLRSAFGELQKDNENHQRD